MNKTADKIAEITVKKSGVSRLTLTEFRNYDFLRLNFADSPVVITGENGSGKTNILEAISFLTPGRGLRGAKLSDIKRIGSNESRLTNGWAVAAIIKKINP